MACAPLRSDLSEGDVRETREVFEDLRVLFERKILCLHIDEARVDLCVHRRCETREPVQAVRLKHDTYRVQLLPADDLKVLLIGPASYRSIKSVRRTVAKLARHISP